MKIVFDTNIWINDLGLNSSAGAAVRFYIKKTGAVVVIPEVVRLELEKNFTQKLRDLKKGMIKSRRELLTVFGKLKEVVLPTDEEINNRASELLNQLDIPVEELPFSLDAAKSSFLKILDKQPPSSEKNQQFKDGVIWANCLDLLNEDDVCFVTEDKAFYKDRDYRKGPALNLQKEAEKYPNTLTLLPGLDELLKDIKEEVNVDDSRLIQGIFETSGEQIYEVLDQADFSLGNSPAITKNLFLTENASQLHAVFNISYDCVDQTDEERTNASLTLEGSGLYEINKEEFQNVYITNVRLKYIDTGGQEQTSGYVSARASGITAGYKTIEYTVRRQL